MAYQLLYTLAFNNRITENLSIEIYRKGDTPPDQVLPLKCTYANKKFINGQGDKFDTIISSELNIGVFIGLNDPVDFDDILVSFTDEWKVILKNDGQIDFVGWLVPNECKASFRDKPYEFELTATDGLGYLKDIPLTDNLGNSFVDYNGMPLIIEYVAGSLKKTLLDLNIRVYCNIYESTFLDRLHGTTGHKDRDMFNQARLDYRTFLNDPIVFMSCYDALLTMLGEGFTLFQWFGKWVIMRIGEMQYSVGPVIYYTEYDSNGQSFAGVLESFGAAQVAKQQILHPVNANQEILTRFAVKSAKTSFNYDVWPEIPTNNKFERGSIRTTQTLPGPPIQYVKKYNIDSWEYRVGNPFNGAFADTAYRQSTENEFHVETLREIVLERNSGGSGHRFLTCQKIPVNVNDKVSISYDFRSSVGGTGNVSHLFVTLETLNGSPFPYKLNSAGGAVPVDSVGTLVWEQTQAIKFINTFYSNGRNANDYTSYSFTTPSFPISGYLYICMVSFDPPQGRVTSYKNFNIEYIPRLGGMNVEGDYWFTSQNTQYRDIIEKTIGISDCQIRVVKGTIYRTDGITPTDKSWRRGFVQETREYKEFINMARYNAAYRRTWQISGTFGGTMFHPYNDQTIRLPLGFHKQFTFPDSSKLDGYYFQLVPPLTIDYGEGTIDATFVDCMKTDSNGNTIDGSNLGDVHEFKFVFKNE